MVSIPSDYYGAYQYVAGIFQIRPEWLVWPSLLTIFLWPLVLNIFMYYYILNKLVRVFPGGVNMVLAGIMAFLSLPYGQYTAYAAPLIIGIWGVSWGGVSGIFGRILIIGLLMAMTFFILPWVVSLRF